MTKEELIKWLECSDTIPEVRAVIASLGDIPPGDQAAWSLAWIADQVRACDDPAASAWATWTSSAATRTLLHRTLFAFAPDSDPIRKLTLELVRARVIHG